jgi:SAM-dependent methyltransferase
MKDLFGRALMDYQSGNYTEDIITSTSISDDDVLPLPYLFRDYEAMPALEQRALQMARGAVLDVGCGAGNHSLYLQAKGLEVMAIDISEGAITVCRDRGVENAQLMDLAHVTGSFDTILLLMNGSGFLKDLANTPKVLRQLKSLLNPGGQILLDSSDIKYMYEDDDGGYWMDVNANYYGELEYVTRYKGEEESFPWMYLDFERLKIASESVGLQCELVLEGAHYDYLARLS